MAVNFKVCDSYGRHRQEYQSVLELEATGTISRKTNQQKSVICQLGARNPYQQKAKARRPRDPLLPSPAWSGASDRNCQFLEDITQQTVGDDTLGSRFEGKMKPTYLKFLFPATWWSHAFNLIASKKHTWSSTPFHKTPQLASLLMSMHGPNRPGCLGHPAIGQQKRTQNMLVRLMQTWFLACKQQRLQHQLQANQMFGNMSTSLVLGWKSNNYCVLNERYPCQYLCIRSNCGPHDAETWKQICMQGGLLTNCTWAKI